MILLEKFSLSFVFINSKYQGFVGSKLYLVLILKIDTSLNFGELFSGEWVEKAFGIDRAAYEKAFDTWHKNNIKLLNSYGINDA